MNEWDGKERRGVSNDWIERDRLLSEVHSDCKHIVQWAKDHTSDDEKRFEKVNKDIDNGKKIVYGGLGAFALIEFIMKFLK